MNSRALIKGFFDSRSTSGPSAALVNHQLGSFNDFLPHENNKAPWMQRVVDNISVGADESLRGAIRLELGDLEAADLGTWIDQLAIKHKLLMASYLNL